MNPNRQHYKNRVLASLPKAEMLGMGMTTDTELAGRFREVEARVQQFTRLTVVQWQRMLLVRSRSIASTVGAAE